MYQFVLGKISTLCADPLASTFADSAPQGARNASWLAGRMLLARALSPHPLPDIIYGEQGKPAFAEGHPLWFNLSHSGDDIALLMSDEGEVGCDIEVIRPRKNWQALANAVFSMTEHDELEREAPEERLAAFWRIWTRKRRSSNSVAVAHGRLSALTARRRRTRSARCRSDHSAWPFVRRPLTP